MHAAVTFQQFSVSWIVFHMCRITLLTMVTFVNVMISVVPASMKYFAVVSLLCASGYTIVWDVPLYVYPYNIILVSVHSWLVHTPG